MAQVDYTILITDKNLAVVGDPIVCWITLDVTLRFNEPGSGLFTCPANPWIVSQLAAGNRVVIMRNQTVAGGRAGDILIAGPIEKWLFERSDDGENSGVGKLTVNFADDLAMVVARCVYPDPTLTPETQTIDRWKYGPGNAEVALRTLVNGNAGPGALTARRVPQLALGALASVGTNVTVDADRMMPMGDLMREIADNGGGIGFRTRQSGTQILFEVYAPPDKSNQVRFGFSLGNMKYLAYEVVAPTATAVVVGGQGEGADRYVMERVNATDQAAWGRLEKLVSRPGNSGTQALSDDGDKELGSSASTTRIPSNVADTDDQQFGVHYDLGTRVAVETFPGQQYTDIVVTVHLQAWATAGTYVAATVGSQAAHTDPLWVERLKAIEDRLSTVERNVKPAVKPA